MFRHTMCDQIPPWNYELILRTVREVYVLAVLMLTLTCYNAHANKRKHTRTHTHSHTYTHTHKHTNKYKLLNMYSA